MTVYAQDKAALTGTNWIDTVITHLNTGTEKYKFRRQCSNSGVEWPWESSRETLLSNLTPWKSWCDLQQNCNSEGLSIHHKAHLETEVTWWKIRIQRARLNLHQWHWSEKVLCVFSCFCFCLFLGKKREQTVAIRKARTLKVREKIKAKT